MEKCCLGASHSCRTGLRSGCRTRVWHVSEHMTSTFLGAWQSRGGVASSATVQLAQGLQTQVLTGPGR